MTWVLNIHVSREDTGNHHVYAVSDGDTREEALAAVRLAKEVFVRDRLTAMRVEPEVESDTDFDTKETRHRGLVRFTFVDEAGECIPPRPFNTVPLSAA